jgi:hypothetical protein
MILTLRKIIKCYEAAVRNHAYIGAAHPLERTGILKEYRFWKKTLVKELSKGIQSLDAIRDVHPPEFHRITERMKDNFQDKLNSRTHKAGCYCKWCRQRRPK